jgi:hypothetical protein
MAAYLCARQNSRLKNIRNRADWEEAVSEVAEAAVSTLQNQLRRGKLTKAANPIKDFRGYVRGIVDGHAKDRNRTKTPSRISRYGQLAVAFFQRVVVYGDDFHDVQRELELNNPSQGAFIRDTLAPIILEELKQQDYKSKREGGTLRAPQPVSDVRGSEDDPRDLLEERDPAVGRRISDPLEELIETIDRRRLEVAVNSLPPLDRDMVRAYFIERRYRDRYKADLARDFGVRNGADQVRRLRRKLVRLLEAMSNQKRL